jgi:hypothetical protein
MCSKLDFLPPRIFSDFPSFVIYFSHVENRFWDLFKTRKSLVSRARLLAAKPPRAERLFAARGGTAVARVRGYSRPRRSFRPSQSERRRPLSVGLTVPPPSLCVEPRAVASLALPSKQCAPSPTLGLPSCAGGRSWELVFIEAKPTTVAPLHTEPPRRSPTAGGQVVLTAAAWASTAVSSLGHRCRPRPLAQSSPMSPSASELITQAITFRLGNECVTAAPLSLPSLRVGEAPHRAAAFSLHQ